MDPSVTINTVTTFDLNIEASILEVSQKTHLFDVRLYGALGNGAADDSAGIDLAIEAAQVASSLRPATLYFPPGFVFTTSTGHAVPSGINVVMESPLIATAAANAPIVCLSIGTPGAKANSQRHVIWVQRQTVSDWTSENDIGVRFYNLRRSDVTVHSAFQFTIGAQFLSDGAGVAYNEVTLLHFVDNKIGLDLVSVGAAGWVNENNWYGGAFSITSTGHKTHGMDSDVYGVRIRTENGAYHSNNNVFHKPSFELGQSHTAGRSLPVLCSTSNNSQFLQCRSENSNKVFAVTENSSGGNVFDLGYDGCFSVISEEGTKRGNVLRLPSKRITSERLNFVFDSGPIHKTAHYINETYITVPGCFIGGGSSSTAFSALDGLTLDPNYISTNARGVGVFVSTVNAKKLVVKRDNDIGYGGRLVIRCYDASGAILNSAGCGHPYVMDDQNDFYYTSKWGSAYVSNNDVQGDKFFEVGADVAYVALLLTGGTAGCRMRSFKIYAVDGNATAWAL